MLRFLPFCFLSVVLLPSVAAQDKAVSLRHEDVKGAGSAVRPAGVEVVNVPCVEGAAGAYACKNVDLLSFLPVAALTDADSIDALNDIWGWTDPDTGREYALVGRRTGVSFVDVTDPYDPTYLGNLPRTPGTAANTWRDVKVYGHYALVVADNVGAHGMQVFDLHELRSVATGPATFSATALYDEIDNAHNIVVNESSGYAFAVGGSGSECGPGLHMIDVRDPLAPSFAGCFVAAGTGRVGNGYTHDAQCVDYHGADSEYVGREICFGANETALIVADVTEKEAPIEMARATYPGVQYAHQGWLTEDHRYFLMDDELDEAVAHSAGESAHTRTIVWDVMDLDDPQVETVYEAATTSIDHNQYVVNGRSYQANYTSGLRVLDASNPGNLREIAFFDTYPAGDGVSFDGAWSVYPYFESGNVLVSGINEGLFVLRPTGEAAVAADRPPDVPASFRLLPAYPNPFNMRTLITLEVDRPQQIRVTLHDLQGRQLAELYSGFVPEAGRRTLSLDAAGFASGVYVVRADGVHHRRTATVTLQK